MLEGKDGKALPLDKILSCKTGNMAQTSGSRVKESGVQLSIRLGFSNCPSRALTAHLSSTCEHGVSTSLLLGLLCPPAIMQMNTSRALPLL